MTNKHKNGRWIAGSALAIGVLGIGAISVGVAQTQGTQSGSGRAAGTSGEAAGTGGGSANAGGSGNAGAGAGGGGAGGASPTGTPAAATQEPKMYVAQLFGANGLGATGTARFIIDGDHFGAVVEGSGLDPGIRHLIHVHSGSTCPTIADDKNGDGYVDAREGTEAGGGILIPLDGDLSSQAQGLTYGPTGAIDGTILYAGSGSYEAMIRDLNNSNNRRSVDFAKLNSGEDLALETRTVEIHGVSQALPNTVQGLEGLSNSESLTVACGQIVQVSGPIATGTPTPTESPTATASPGESPTATPTVTESPTETPSPGESPTATPSPGESPTATPSPGETGSPEASPSPSASPSPTP